MVSNCVSQVSTMTTKHHVMCLFTLSILLPHSSYRGEVDSSSSSSVGEHLNQPLSRGCIRPREDIPIDSILTATEIGCL
jgi:hypothetical protein